MVWVFALVMASPLAILVFGFIAIECPWLLERNPPERRLLLAMLKELELEDWAWERSGGTYRHKDSGISFEYYYHFDLTVSGQKIRFDNDSKGGRICRRIINRMAKAEKQTADLLALKNMSEALDRMNCHG